MLNGIPEEAALLATHMFLFYFAVLAEVTPPVALSAYAASSVMGTDPIRTGVYAARVALPKYLIGLTLILSLSGTALLIIPVVQALPLGEAIAHIFFTFLFTIMGIFFLNVAVVGYFRENLTTLQRYVVGLCAVLLFYPSYMFSVGALVVCSPLLIRKVIKTRTVGQPLHDS
jgi:TRAP-type uncharacterized transport system fused permease subunit